MNKLNPINGSGAIRGINPKTIAVISSPLMILPNNLNERDNVLLTWPMISNGNKNMGEANSLK